MPGGARPTHAGCLLALPDDDDPLIHISVWRDQEYYNNDSSENIHT
jgi:hypothetical protein